MNVVDPMICYLREILNYVPPLIRDIFEHETGHMFLRDNDPA